jgi:hypothetical protein
VTLLLDGSKYFVGQQRKETELGLFANRGELLLLLLTGEVGFGSLCSAARTFERG